MKAIVPIEKYKKQLERVEKELQKVRGANTMDDGWQTQRFAKKARKWDKLSEEKFELLENIECCESEDPDEMCDNCNCWKFTRLSCG